MQTSLVTGASKGIGLAIAERLARDGHKVIGIARSEPDRDFPGDYCRVDLEDVDTAAGALQEIVAAQPVDNLVNNAGYSIPQPVFETDLADFDKQIAVNLRGALICAQACLPAMRAKKHGRIVNISSRAMLGKEDRTAYAAAKAGLIGFTRVWATELAGNGITVNAIAPGPIETALFLRNHPPGSEKYKALEDTVPVGRMGTPDDIAAAVAYFVSDDASFVTGQLLYVCGGLSLGGAPV
ncbi:MAG: SDR family oxidoreductase [Alphaproteobacteria bacterium]|nr:SDR family oxidoreductase [Alphaproteobacteria bacterium]